MATTDYNGLFKIAYADALQDLVPEQNIIMRQVPFKGAAKLLGDTYNQPVILRREQGFTYAGQNAGAFNLNPAVSLKTQPAVVPGWQLLERSAIDYESFYKADNKNAFRNAVDLVMENAMESFNYRLETGMLYGQSASGIGSYAVAPTNVNATTATITIAATAWAVGIWAEAEGASIDVFTTGEVLVNTVGGLTVSAVNTVAKTVTVTGAAADITALDGTTAGYIRFHGASGNEAVGIDKIMTNTGSLFGIDASVYNLWKSNVVTAVPQTLAGILSAVAVAQGRGLNEDAEVLVSPSKWAALLTEQAALRMYDSSYSNAKVDNGSKSITFFSQNGKLTVYSHTYVKDGEGFLLPFSRVTRIGSTDTTFNIPGTDGGKVFRQMDSQAGFEFRLYSNQAILIETPARCVKLTFA